MEKNSIEYDFIPNQVSIGRFNSKYLNFPCQSAFVSCKYEYNTWINKSVFERLCKYPPHDQRNPEAQLKKIIHNAVNVIDNVPTTGFKLVQPVVDLYSMYYDSEKCHDICILDPRGFVICVTASCFYNMLEACGNNMKDGVMTGAEFVYAWSKGGKRFTLAQVGTAKYKKVKKQSDELANKIENTYLKKSQLEIGKMYKGSKFFPGNWMYLGTHPIYGAKYHRKALTDGAYPDLAEFCKDASAEYENITSKSREVFYKIIPNAYKHEYDTYFRGTDCPYVCRSSVSKLLEEEIDIDLSANNCTMHNDSNKLATYKNVKEDFDTNSMFNKFDLSTINSSCRYVSRDTFKYFMHSFCSSNKTNNVSLRIAANKLFPFYVWNCKHMLSGRFRQIVRILFGYDDNVKIIPDDRLDNTNGYYYNSYWNNSNVKILYMQNSLNIDELYDNVKPIAFNAKYENGHEVPEFIGMYFMPELCPYNSRIKFNILNCK